MSKVHASWELAGNMPVCGRALPAFGDDIVVSVGTFTTHKTRTDIRCWECKSIVGEQEDWLNQQVNPTGGK